ncbi:MAG: T9SS type A sorting domain-containing protein [Saprospiraceae bacterium]
MMVDEEFVSAYGPDMDVVRMKAEDIFQDMKDNLEFKLSNLGYVTEFRLVQFSETILSNSSFNPDKTNWATNIRNRWKFGDKKCISKDIIILLSGRMLEYAGHMDGGVICEEGVFDHANVVIVTAANMQGKTLGHEIMHTFGLDHLNDPNPTICHPACTDNDPSTPYPLMCYQGGDYHFTSCDIICMKKFFDTIKCPCLQIQNPSFDSDFICPPTGTMSYGINLENPNPVLNCRSEGDIVTVTATFFNNNEEIDRNFRVVISGDESTKIEFEPDSESPFNCIVTLPSSSKEFRITDPVTPNCENEVFFPFVASEAKTLKFKLKYLGGLTLFQSTVRVSIYTGDGEGEKKQTLDIRPYIQVNNTSFSALYATATWKFFNPLIISGKLTMNPSSTPGWAAPYSFGENKKLLFASGAELEIAPGSTVKMPHIQIEGCSTMWKGITVRDGATLEMNMMTSVADAQFAVNVQKGGIANVQSCKFVNNNFGIRTAPEGTDAHDITALGNRFVTMGNGLKPTWGAGQQPPPDTKGFAGIYAKDLVGGLSIDNDPVFGLTNEFSNLHYGIFAEHTDITVRDAIFTNITREARPASYPGPFLTGIAVYSSFGKADVKGSFTGIAPDPVVMDNCHTGINVLGGSIDVAGCEMGNMTNGIIAGGGGNKAYNIYWNNISASERGISVFYQSGLPGQSSIDNNIVHMVGNPTGVGIANGGQEMFPQQEGFVVNNHVTMEEGATGIQIGVANRIKVTQNNVNLSGNGTLFGIKIEGGDRNVLNCNSVFGTGGNNDGIYAVHASRASVLCNHATGPARGLHFEGMLAGKNKADIGGNTMEDNSEAGLLLGTDAVTGGQVHRGNKWEGTGALAGIGADLHSQFTVDANENSDFLPDAWLPFAWFLDVAIPSPSFDCGFPTTCPPLPASPSPSDYPLDFKIMKGALGGATYQAANQWLSQRRFYELVIEEGNPYPGNTHVSTFLSQVQANGLSGYADVQVGIRQLGAMSEGSRATAAANLWTLNNALTGNASYQVNEKLVNQIFLQTIAIGNLEFSEIQITSLEGIAELCPLSDGEAVLRARAMLQLVQGTLADYDDISICGIEERSQRNKQDVLSVRIYPNPANNSLTIEYSGIGSSNNQFLLFNTLGQVVKNISLPDGQGSLQLPLRELSEGVYWYVIPGASNTSGKLIISR